MTNHASAVYPARADTASAISRRRCVIAAINPYAFRWNAACLIFDCGTNVLALTIMNTKSFLALVLAASAQASPVYLQPETVHAWEEYLGRADARMQARLNSGKSFLWMDEAPDRRSRVQRGEIVIEPVVGRGAQTVPNGLIHHWIGAVFIPNASLESLQNVVHDYDRYNKIYKPVVIEAHSVPNGTHSDEFSMTWQRHVLFVTAALRARYRVQDFDLDAHRGYSVADTTSVQEIENYGRPSEHLLPSNTGSGFIWRIHSISRYEERDGGVYLEVEAIALTREIPGSLRWLIAPVVNHLSINSMSATLSQTRQAVGEHIVTLASRRKSGGKDRN